LKPSVHTGTGKSDADYIAGCKLPLLTPNNRQKVETERETSYKSLNSSSIYMQVITQKDFIAVYCCKTIRSCVRYGLHVTRSTYLSRQWTALAFRLAQFDIAFQGQIHHIRELERLCTNITLIIFTSTTLPELELLNYKRLTTNTQENV
jgi:hypothetical protein